MVDMGFLVRESAKNTVCLIFNDSQLKKKEHNYRGASTINVAAMVGCALCCHQTKTRFIFLQAHPAF